MSVNFSGVGVTNPSNTYLTGASTANAQDVALYDSVNSDTTDSFTTSAETKTTSSAGKTAGIVAGLAAGALAIGTTIYAFKTGKANLGKGAKLGEVLKNGFKSIGTKISDFAKKLFGKSENVNVEQATKDAGKVLQKTNANSQVKEAADKLVNIKVPENPQTLAKNFQDAYVEQGNKILESVQGDRINSVIHSAVPQYFM